jgi:hypothetical protein
MNKIDIGKALENPNVAKALSEFTVEMMNNSEITEYLKGIINGNEELSSSSTKLIEAIKRYKENLLKKAFDVPTTTPLDVTSPPTPPTPRPTPRPTPTPPPPPPTPTPTPTPTPSPPPTPRPTPTPIDLSDDISEDLSEDLPEDLDEDHTDASPPVAPPQLIRQYSDIYTNQGSEGTCLVHACSSTIARALKVNFSDYFGKQVEVCDYYYKTEGNYACAGGLLFNCFINDKLNNACNYHRGLDRDIERDNNRWSNENISALLFHFIYTIIYSYRLKLEKKKKLEDKAWPYVVIPHFLNTLKKTNIDRTYVDKILDYNASRYEPEENEYFNTIINRLTNMLNDVKTRLNNKSFSLNLYVVYKNNYRITGPTKIYDSKTGISSNTLFTGDWRLAISKDLRLSMSKAKFRIIELAVKNLFKHVLSNGYYATFTTDEHIVVIKDWVEQNGKEYVTIKNSWGRDALKWKIENENYKMEFKKMFDYTHSIDYASRWHFLYPEDKYNEYKAQEAARLAKKPDTTNTLVNEVERVGGMSGRRSKKHIIEVKTKQNKKQKTKKIKKLK